MSLDNTSVTVVCARDGCETPLTQKQLKSRCRYCSHACGYDRPPKSPDVRFWMKVDKNGPIPLSRPELGPCWVWTASTKNGYGCLCINYRQTYSHRWSYEQLVGPIPDGLTIDHLCRERRCVNPKHLEPVTNHENILRGFACRPPRTHCRNGHPLTPENTLRGVDRNGYGHWRCRICKRIDHREYKRLKRLRCKDTPAMLSAHDEDQSLR